MDKIEFKKKKTKSFEDKVEELILQSKKELSIKLARNEPHRDSGTPYKIKSMSHRKRGTLREQRQNIYKVGNGDSVTEKSRWSGDGKAREMKGYKER